MSDRMEAIEKRMSAIEGRFKGSEGDYDKNQAGNTTEPNEMEVHQPSMEKKKKLNLMVAMMKNKKGRDNA